MGCSTSKLDDEEAVQLCKDRRRFIKEAVEQRLRFATGHVAYIQSLRKVSAALRDYIEGDEPREFLLDSYTSTPPFTPIKKASPGFKPITAKSFTPYQIQSKPNTSMKVNYLRSGGNPAVVVEERPPQSPETVRIETYPSMHHYGIDGFFEMQSSPMNSSFYNYAPNNRSNLPPPSPQTSQWDFWNPFHSLDNYGYPNRSSLDQIIMDDDINGLRQVREEEGIPDLEEDETEDEVTNNKVNVTEERPKVDIKSGREDVIIEDEDDEDDEEYETDSGSEVEHEVHGLQAHGSEARDVSQAQGAGQVEVSNHGRVVVDQESNEETPGFTVYVKRRPTSMAEVIKDLESQFTIVCHAASEVSAMLEASKAQYSSMSNELSAVKMLNPVALIRSASSRSSSSRFLTNSSNSREEGFESSSDYLEESSMFSGSHQSSLDKLYAWEKKLYQEVKSGERFRLAYEKKCLQLRNQDVKGEDPAMLDKTRIAIRDLHTQMTVSLHRIESISKRIETLRDEELQPQVLELVQGLARMWKVMAECHQSQKRTLDDAKHLLAGTPSKLSEAKKHAVMSTTEPHHLARLAANLESQIRNWRACFKSWINAQQSYMHALSGWLLRCMRSDAESRLPFSPRRSSGAPPIFGICIHWSRFLDAIHETPVLDGLDFFASGMGSLYAQQLKEDSRHGATGSKRFESHGNMEVMEFGQVDEEVMTMEKMAEVAIRVLCAGMSVAMASLAEFAICSANAYDDLARQWEKAKLPPQSSSQAAV